MKKFLATIFLTLACLFIFTGVVQAQNLCDESAGGTIGVVPCGKYSTDVYGSDGSVIGQTLSCRCELGHLFILGQNLYNFVVFYIATPLAVLLLIIGGLVMVISAGRPNVEATAKRIMWGAVIGISLIYLAWLIINVVLQALGYTNNWSNLNF